MSNWLRKPLSRAEIVGYLISAGGMLVISTQAGFRNPWIEAGVALMIIGVVVAGRGQASGGAPGAGGKA